MAWVTKFQGLISREWQYTEPVDTTLLRVRNLSNPGYRFVSKGFVARSRFIDSKPEIMYLKPFWSEPESIIIDLGNTPEWLNQNPIAFRRDRSYKINWRIAIDAWEGFDPMRTKRTFFISQSSLQNSLYNASHSLEDESCIYQAWDSSGREIKPTDALIIDQNNILFDFSGLEPLEGTYKIVIIK